MLIEVAREGCDLLSAEGRAHLASNAKPMWMALPDGALKRQLLGEIASLCELGTNELQDLWIPPSPTAKRSFDFKKKPRTWTRGTRQIPAGRADHAARVLLSNMEIWQELSGEDHDLLCSLAPPHGPLFVWIDHQHHEHGNLSWAALLEGLRGHECEPLSTRVMSTSFTNTVDDSDATQAQDSANDKQAKDARQELQSILQKILLENLDAQMKQAIDSSQSDPTALTRYKALYERRKQICLNAATPAP